VFAYDISVDGRQVVLEAEDREGKPRLWLTSFEREVSPRPVLNVEGRQPRFGLGGEIFFRGSDGFVYRVQSDAAYPINAILPNRDGTVKFGRIGWKEQDQQKWRHGSPRNLESSTSWNFLTAELWAPPLDRSALLAYNSLH
jgi:hypothetical protein